MSDGEHDEGVLTAYHPCTPAEHKNECKPSGRYVVTTDGRPEPGDWNVLYEFKPMVEDLQTEGDVTFIDAEVAEQRPKQVTAL